MARGKKERGPDGEKDRTCQSKHRDKKSPKATKKKAKKEVSTFESFGPSSNLDKENILIIRKEIGKMIAKRFLKATTKTLFPPFLLNITTFSIGLLNIIIFSISHVIFYKVVNFYPISLLFLKRMYMSIGVGEISTQFLFSS